MKKIFAIIILLTAVSLQAQSRLRLTHAASGGGGGGVGCSPTCLFQSSFTTAQGWSADAFTIGCGASGTTLSGHQTNVNNFGSQSDPTGNCAGVMSAANYPNGAGGRGHRHYRAAGVNMGDGGLAITMSSTVDEIWFRVMERWSNGFDWNSIHYSKDEYWNDLTSSFFICGLQNGVLAGCAIGGSAAVGSGAGWTSVYPTGTSDGSWYCREYHANRTAGTLEGWINGVLQYQLTGLNYSSMTQGFGGFDTNNQSDVKCTLVNCYTDFDDYAVATGLSAGQRIGCL